MITYKREKLNSKLIEEITPILDVHRVELQAEDMRLNPDWESYYLMDKMNKLVTLVARDDDNKIVGYSVYIVGNNMHYKDYLYAIEDVFYVVQDRRSTKIGYNLVKMSEEVLKGMNVDVITHHAKFINTFATFLERLGYRKIETMLSKRL